MNVPLRNKLLSIVLTLALFVGICPAVFAAPSTTGYHIEGAYNDEKNTFSVAIYIHDINAVSGRFALQFDKDKLNLNTNGTLAGTVTAGSGVSLTTEGISNSLLISQDQGHVMIPWYASSTNVDASTAPYLIGTVTFTLADGVTTDDFNRDTLRLKYIKSGMYPGWRDGAYLVSRLGVGYTYNTEREEYMCNVSFDYPNATKEPIYFYTVNLKVIDNLSNPLPATVTVGQTPVAISPAGTGSISLTPGTYTYKASMDGYQTKTESITVKDSDITQLIVLPADRELVEAAAAALEIGFSGTDSYESVTSNLVFPSTGLYNTTVEWESDLKDVITSSGAVIPRNEEAVVKVTATVTRKISTQEVTATRVFPLLHVKESGVTDEMNRANLDADTDMLEIKFAPGDHAGSVTSDVILTERGAYGSRVEWESDREDLIANDGVLGERPQQDTQVQLTAKLYNGDYDKQKTFTVTVKAQKSENSEQEKETTQQIVDRVAADLEIGYADGDNKDHVTKNLTLINRGREDTDISWKSSNELVVTKYGDVTPPQSDQRVTLTATVSKDGVETKKEFDPVLVLKEEVKGPTDSDKFEKDYNVLEIGYAVGDSKDSITSNLTLPRELPNGSTVEWESSKEDIIDKSGTLLKRPEQNTAVTLTATLTLGKLTDKRVFAGLQVIAAENTEPDPNEDQEAVKKAAEGLTITYGAGDSASNVTQNLGLPVNGTNGCKIEWFPSNEAIISKEGKVERPEDGIDVTITLTAHISKNDAKEQKAFPVTVIAKSSGPSTGVRPVVPKPKPGPGGNTSPEQTVSPTASPTASPAASPLPTQMPGRFTDLDGVEWAKDAIYALAEKGVIKGTSETEFSPANPIRRGDFVALLVRMFQLESEYTSFFDDVAQDSYYYPEITTAKSLGIIDGVGDNCFNPEGMITRQDMMTMTYRALLRLNKIPQEVQNGSVSFNDADQIADYAAEAVQVLVSMQLIQGNAENNVCPLDQTTRAESAVFLNRIDQLK